ncbi:hypothetical protein EVAR_2994_1 [Eumeta japonica]|uniref:Uncharacterized protein n=1 Tax=Eumeta variegata TaxID=151549 RepID=A0A4C1SWC4_EUMVA|nr:hypothetical protein EVAR_2994_1 [Eumeta japonica]
MGRAWERLVRSIKTTLKATPNARAPIEVLYMVLLEAENIVNSRPLTHVSVDTNDPVALTPNHFLLESASEQPPPGRFDHADFCTRKQ